MIYALLAGVGIGVMVTNVLHFALFLKLKQALPVKHILRDERRFED